MPFVNDLDTVHVAEQIGATRHLTPEGFLLCEAVPIARTGTLIYRAGEIDGLQGKSGFVSVDRSAHVLFDPTAVSSFVGKPVTDNHPADPNGVLPSNWRQFAVGLTRNVRRGEGIQADLLLADLLIMDADTIAAVQAGKREVSCGYEADYEQDAPGSARVISYRGNHVALVEAGRCGPRCAIQDAKERTMTKRTIWDRIRTAAKANDEEALNAEIEAAKAESEATGETQTVVIKVEAGEATVTENTATEGDGPAKDDEGGTPDLAAALTEALAPIGAKLDAMEARIAKLEGGDGSEAGTSDKTMDGLDAAFRDAAAKGEILVPGFTLPTFDAKAKATDMEARLADFRRGVLGKAATLPRAKGAVEAVLAGKALADLKDDALAFTFDTAASLVKTGATASLTAPGRLTGGAGKIVTPADLQKRIEAHRAGK